MPDQRPGIEPGQNQTAVLGEFAVLSCAVHSTDEQPVHVKVGLEFIKNEFIRI